MPKIEQTPNDPVSTTSPETTVKRSTVFLVLAAWVLLVIGGYYVGKLYIDRSIQSVHQTNAVHIQTMQNQLDSMAGAIEEIQLALSNADQTLATSGITQENLNKKIEALDKQLQLLAESLAVLKEAP